MKIYFISGLGADHRAFERIKLPAGYEMIHLDWIPAERKEDLTHYSLRMAEKIDSSEPFMLAGLSFGGIVASEIAKILKPRRLILISTVATKDGLPMLYKLAGKLHLDKILPAKAISPIRPFANWFFGIKDKETENLLNYFRRNSNPKFLKWAISKIIRWNNQNVYPFLIQIHGGRDRVFPAKKSLANYVIKSAGHLCVFSKANLINAILRKELS